MRRSDVIFGVGSSFTKHGMSMKPAHWQDADPETPTTPRDLNKDYDVQFPLIGDARLALRQMIEACREIVGDSRRNNAEITGEIASVREAWLAEWEHKTNDAGPLVNPYRVITDFQKAVPRQRGHHHPRLRQPPATRSPRSTAPAVRAPTWAGGSPHGLGTGLGLVIGAKLADPDKMCVNFMGDAAFGMVGLDFETAVRSSVPITTVVLNNSTMAVETNAMQRSHELYKHPGTWAATTPTWVARWAATPSASPIPTRSSPLSSAPDSRTKTATRFSSSSSPTRRSTTRHRRAF